MAREPPNSSLHADLVREAKFLHVDPSFYPLSDGRDKGTSDTIATQTVEIEDLIECLDHAHSATVPRLENGGLRGWSRGSPHPRDSCSSRGWRHQCSYLRPDEPENTSEELRDPRHPGPKVRYRAGGQVWEKGGRNRCDDRNDPGGRRDEYPWGENRSHAGVVRS